MTAAFYGESEFHKERRLKDDELIDDDVYIGIGDASIENIGNEL